MTTHLETYRSVLEQVCAQSIGPAASEVDVSGSFPVRSIDALRKAKLMGAVSAAAAKPNPCPPASAG